jgi:hypothetical protein
MVNKKGAMELSINTIVVIVIGVTMLTLGLVFVRNIVGKSQDLSESAFSKASEELDKLGGSTSEFITLSSENIKMKDGDANAFGVLVKNVEEDTYNGVNAKIITSDEAKQKGISCEFIDGKSTRSLGKIAPGKEFKIRINVKTKKGSTGIYGCEFKLEGGGIEDQPFVTSREVTVKVE